MFYENTLFFVFIFIFKNIKQKTHLQFFYCQTVFCYEKQKLFLKHLSPKFLKITKIIISQFSLFSHIFSLSLSFFFFQQIIT